MIKFPTAAAALAAVVATTLLPAQPASAAPALRLTRIQYNPPGDDTGSNAHLNKEWVKITNLSNSRKTLTGWKLRDNAGHVFRFPTFRLRPDHSVKIHTGRGTNTRTDLYWRQDWYIWNNDGDRAVLKKPTGTLWDSCRYDGGGQAVNC